LLVESPVLEALRVRKRDKLGNMISEFWKDRSMENLGKVLEETQTVSLSELIWYTESQREYFRDRKNSA